MAFTRGQLKIALILAAVCNLSLIGCAPPNQLHSPTANQIQARSESSPEAIVGGYDILDSFPLSKNVVLLVNAATEEVCTATLLGGPFALTAAHCLDSANLDDLFVFFGPQPNSRSERRQVIAAKVSPYWELRKFEDRNTSDVAVLRFAGNSLPRGYQAVKFLEDDRVLRNGTKSIILGYGINDAIAQTGAGKLRFTTLTITDRNFSPTELVLDQSKGSGACHGDSGGPAFIVSKDSQGRSHYYLWGIANHATPDDTNNHCNTGVIYTNATLFLTWIQIAIQSL